MHIGSFLVGVAATISVAMIYYLIVTQIERRHWESDVPTSASGAYWADKGEQSEEEFEGVRIVYPGDEPGTVDRQKERDR